MKHYIFATVLLLGQLQAGQAQAASDYKKMDNCGSAQVISGDTCSNVKVEFKFDGCALKSEKQEAKKISCEGQKVKARLQEGDYRYEAEFLKAEDGWGGVTWKSLGPVKQWEKKSAVAANKPAAKVAAAPVVAAPPTQKPAPQAAQPVAQQANKEAAVPVAPQTVAAMAAPVAETSTGTLGTFKFSGFFDARYSNYNAKQNPSPTDGHKESGFGIEDGAVYMNYEKDRLSFVADVAFRRSKLSDTSGTGSDTQSNNSNFAIGVDKSQLYLKYKLLESVNVYVGQFDTIYGVELNDSKDRVFGKTGLVYDNTLPVTHTGAMLEWANYGFSVKGFAANPNNKGTYGTSEANRDENTEYGGAVGYSNDHWRAQAGYMGRPILKAGSTTDQHGTRSLIDVTAGTTWGRFSADVEYARVDDPSKNTLTPDATSDHENAGSGVLGLVTMKIVEPLLLGIRYEHLTDDPAGLNFKTADSYGVSAHWRFRPDLEMRAEYTGYNYENVTNAKWNESRVNVATLVFF